MGKEKESSQEKHVLGEGSAFDEFGNGMGSVAQMKRRGYSSLGKSGTFVMACLRKRTLSSGVEAAFL